MIRHCYLIGHDSNATFYIVHGSGAEGRTLILPQSRTKLGIGQLAYH